MSAYKVQSVNDTRTDSNGNTLSQPYGAAVVSVPLPRKQIYLGGPTYQGATSNVIGYSTKAAVTLHQDTSSSDTSWTAYPHQSQGARLTVSSKQTIVSVVFIPTSPSGTVISQGVKTSGTVEIVTWDGTTQNILTPFKSGGSNQEFDIWEPTWTQAHSNAISEAVGDIDGDGKDEIAFTIGNYFVILDDDLSTVLYQGYVTSDGNSDTDTANFHPSCVAAGDIKGDGSTEFVVTYGNSTSTYTGLYKVFGGAAPAVIASGNLTNGTYSLRYANVAIGDIDGDGVNEVVFAGPPPSSDCVLLAADWSNSSLSFSSKAYDNNGAAGGSYGGWQANPIPPLATFCPNVKTSATAGSANSNNAAYILAWDRILQYSPSSGFTSIGLTNTVSNSTNVAAADINYDGTEELVTLVQDGNEIDIYDLNSTGALQHTYISVAAGVAPSLCLADVDGQSLTCQYIGHTVQYSNPQVIAVLASPPYYSDASSNSAFGNCGTTFGSTTSSSSTSSSSFTVSADFTVGYKAEAPFNIAESTNTVTVGASFTAAFENEKEKSYTHEYTTMAGQDAVIFSVVPFDVYSYKILSAPNAASVGTTMTVNFPRTPQVIQMERSAFNALPANTIQIGSSVLSHTLGTPSSYPSIAAIQAACTNGMYDPAGMSAPVGASQYSTDTIETSNGHTTTMGGGLSVTASSENEVMGAVFGATLGLSADYNYSVSTTSSTSISGAVPGINSTDPNFQFGIASYNLKNTAVQPSPFMVVTYWVK